MTEKNLEKYLEDAQKQEAPEAPPVIQWIEEPPKTVIVQFTVKPDYAKYDETGDVVSGNKWESVTLMASTDPGDKDIKGQEVTLWTTPTTLNQALKNLDINTGDNVGIKYHEERKGSKAGRMVKIFSAKNYGR